VPNVPGVPGLRLPEHRPAPVNPPPPESIRPGQPSGEIVLRKGKASVSIPSVVVIALLTSMSGAAVAWLNKPPPGDPGPIIKDVRDQMAAQKRDSAIQSDAILKRLDGVETKVDRLQDSQDRLRERVNDRLAQP